MNLHMPQDVESDSELLNLAAVPYNIISPANNAPIIGIFQDSMLGSYLFTKSNVNFTKAQAMDLLMSVNNVNINIFNDKERISNFDLLTQILPPFSLKTKNKQYDDDEDKKTSNNIIEINNGEYIRGQLDKGILGGGTKGILQRICNDFGNIASADFIDNLQRMITDYMTKTSFSVGISDLISDNTIKDKIINVITDKKNKVKDIIDQTQLGIFENETGKTNQEEFEVRINNILNQATSEAGKIGLKSLSKDNHFVIMVNAGSKGSDLNIAQMIACLGQQNVDGKRIPYGFEHRTLPHYTKYDDSPTARGFVENSYINGLTPNELFFHAMGGRVGLIDTAVKTSTTGYIQRRLIKSMEDLMVRYDGTVRSSKDFIIQFSYGDDGMDTTKVENQELKLVNMSIEDIYLHYNVPEEVVNKTLNYIFIKPTIIKFKKEMKEKVFIEKLKYYTSMMIDYRDEIVKKVFKYKDDHIVRCPVAFSYIINNVMGQQNINANSLVDITFLEAFELIENNYKKMEKIYYFPPKNLFKVLYYFYLSPRDILINKRFNKTALIILLETITLFYKKAIVAPGEMVGMIAGQSIGEPTTQLSECYSEHIRCVKINKNTKNISMLSGEIGKMCDDIIEKLPEYTFNTGLPNSVETLLEPLEDEYYIIGVDKEEKTHWNKISHISRHPVNGELMKVTTRSGRSVTTTPAHSHLVRRNQQVVPIVGYDMKVGMRIPVAKHIDNDFVNDTIKIGEETFKLDYLFGWFIGAYLAEGSLSRKGKTGNVLANGSITITNIHPLYIENVKKFAYLFGKECKIREKEGRILNSKKIYKGIDTTFYHRELAEFINTTCGNGSFIKRVPDFAFLAPNEFKGGLIQGYFDGDGNFMNDKNHHQIRVCSRSFQLIKDISLLLAYFDIFGSIHTKPKHKIDMHYLAISSRYSVLYKENISSLLHIEKLDNLVDYTLRDNIHNLSDDIDRIEGLGFVIAECGKKLKLPGQSRNYGRWIKKEMNGIPIGRRTLRKYIDIFENNEKSHLIQNELKILNQAVSSNVIWDEIVDIQFYTPDQSEYVYDFTVPQNQTFMNDSGIIVHNTLNTFHSAGLSTKSNVTRGVPRIQEVLSVTANPKEPSLTIYLKSQDETNKDMARSIMYMLEHTQLEEIVKTIEICFDPDDLDTLIEEDRETIKQYKEFENMFNECLEEEEKNLINEKSKWILRMELDPSVMLKKNITMDDINFTLKNSYGDTITCIYSDYNSDKLIFRIRMNTIIKVAKNPQMSNIKNKQIKSLDQTDEIYFIKNFKNQLLKNIVLRGVKKINKVLLRKLKDNKEEKSGIFVKKEIWVLDTIGTNLLEVLGLNYINQNKTFSNDIVETFNVLGIEAARQTIYNELSEVLEFDGTYINYHHMALLVDRMTYASNIISVFRHGINNDDIGPIAKTSFEETNGQFLKAAIHAELDIMRGVSANVMVGSTGFYGTSSFDIVLDMKQMGKLNEDINYEYENKDDEIQKLFQSNLENKQDYCSIHNLKIDNNVININTTNMGEINDKYVPF